ncbi:exonuclease domain-containing protein [Actinotalea sp. M2MS4P-6]|uniref:exonuclease domain-containing protein n=1 Tax=Actinotalea sp. M2MS4P-6 TaxID=2983762 RepID=UPI0021E3C0AB|nr:exonuclease domain-containing protein [Actinotalea sp. M2MS4P-6]MCV2395503.1 exonuclease domain-containing protein [Actinotalea sp. M2MS4P-6]
MAWVDQPLVGFDTETTGVDVDRDRIVTAAIVRRTASGTTVSRWLIDPGVDIPAAATAVHGITTEHARAWGVAPREALDEIAETLASAVVRAEPVVAFNASFDLTLLDAELRRHGLPTLPDRLGHPLRAVLDPLVLDRHLDRYRRGKRRLADVCAHYGVAAEGLHAADADVVATLDVLAAMTQVYPQLAGTEPEELHRRQVDAHRLWAESFNAWRRDQGLAGPGAETTWPCRDARHLGGAAVA